MSNYGKVYVVGIGPGLHDHMTNAAKVAIEKADIIVGYSTYLE
ncbi:MAG: SAM-dependent methyltransferase, partial [Acidaminobacteraceae bacterium]